MSAPSFDKKASSWLEIDLSALAANYNLFKDRTGSACETAAVIKADGYGLGVDKVLATLENQNCPFYYVATLEEALHVRSLTKKPVAVFGGLYPECEDAYIHENIIPVLNSLEQTKRWQAAAANHDIPLPAIIHFDTGMNRLGLDEKETKKLHEDSSILDGLNIFYMLTHFACSDEKDHPMNDGQLEKFLQVTSPFSNIKKSLANSSGILRKDEYHLDQVRPGIGLYGGNPLPEAKNPMAAVVRLFGRILQVRTVNQSCTAGYGATYRFDKESRLATVALGYADGFLRSLSSNDNRCAHVYYQGTACPIIGRVSMDAIIIDISHLDKMPHEGEAVEILGPHQSVDDLAVAAGTIGYEILTDLGQRYRRYYI